MLVGYLQSRDRRYIMKSFFLEVNENIETHVAKEKKKQNKKQNHNKQFVSLIDKNLVFVRVHPNEHFAMTCLFPHQGQQEPMRSTAKRHIFTLNQ